MNYVSLCYITLCAGRQRRVIVLHHSVCTCHCVTSLGVQVARDVLLCYITLCARVIVLHHSVTETCDCVTSLCDRDVSLLPHCVCRSPEEKYKALLTSLVQTMNHVSLCYIAVCAGPRRRVIVLPHCVCTCHCYLAVCAGPQRRSTRLC